MKQSAIRLTTYLVLLLGSLTAVDLLKADAHVHPGLLASISTLLVCLLVGLTLASTRVLVPAKIKG